MAGMKNAWDYRLVEVRLYQSPNLLRELLNVATITAPAEDNNWSIENLIRDLSSRQANSYKLAFVGNEKQAQNGDPHYKNCYRTTRNNIVAADPTLKAVITVDLKQSYFIHAVLVVEDISSVDDKDMMTSYKIYIGDAASYTDNLECT